MTLPARRPPWLPFGARHGGCRLAAADEPAADGVGAEAGAVGFVEDEAFVGEVGADQEALLEHRSAVFAQDGDRGVVEGDRAAAL